MAKDFTQQSDCDYDQTYSPLMDAITYHYLICFVIFCKLAMRQLNVVTMYLYDQYFRHMYLHECTPKWIAHYNATSSL